MSLIIKSNDGAVLNRNDTQLDLSSGSVINFTITNPDSFEYSNVGAYLIVSGYVNEDFKDRTPDEMLNQILAVTGENSGLFIRTSNQEDWVRFNMNSGSDYSTRIILYQAIEVNASLPFQLKFVGINFANDILLYVGLTIEGTYA